MGNVKNISMDSFPKQGGFLGKEVKVCFHYDTDRTMTEMMRCKCGKRFRTAKGFWRHFGYQSSNWHTFAVDGGITHGQDLNKVLAFLQEWLVK